VWSVEWKVESENRKCGSRSSRPQTAGSEMGSWILDPESRPSLPKFHNFSQIWIRDSGSGEGFQKLKTPPFLTTKLVFVLGVPYHHHGSYNIYCSTVQ
jgi:hypothetical protein